MYKFVPLIDNPQNSNMNDTRYLMLRLLQQKINHGMPSLATDLLLPVPDQRLDVVFEKLMRRCGEVQKQLCRRADFVIWRSNFSKWVSFAEGDTLTRFTYFLSFLLGRETIDKKRVIAAFICFGYIFESCLIFGWSKEKMQEFANTATEYLHTSGIEQWLRSHGGGWHWLVRRDQLFCLCV